MFHHSYRTSRFVWASCAYLIAVLGLAPLHAQSPSLTRRHADVEVLVAIPADRYDAQRDLRRFPPIAEPVITAAPRSVADIAPQIPRQVSSETRIARAIQNNNQLVEELPATDSVDENVEIAPERLEWWLPKIQGPVFPKREPVAISLSSLLVSALQHSAQIDVFKDLPIIKEMDITQADAEFDWTSFVQSSWRDINEPTGSLLQTNQRRFLDKHFTSEAGIRRRTTLGSELKIGNQIGHQNTNSQFIVPNNQGTTRISIRYTQPLLRGAGKIYNTSYTVLAQIRAGEAQDEFSRDLQSHLISVTRYYWELYLARGNLLQRQRLLVRAKQVYDELQKRKAIDTIPYQLHRALAAVKSRQAEIDNAVRQVHDAEAKIRTSVNDPSLGQSGQTELIPSESPWIQPFPIQLEDSVQHALRNRPEIRQAIKRVQQAGVRMTVAENELLPMLDLILESYANGLQGNSDIAGAYQNAFTDGRPSYTIGLRYEMPYGNRAARARYDQKRAELRQLEKQIRATTEKVKLDVELAVNNTQTTFREIDSKTDALRAEAKFVRYLTDRWKLLPGQNQRASQQLEDLFEAHERLTQAEFELLSKQLTFSLSQMTYKQATGILLDSENISVDRYCENYLPAIDLRKGN